jgi:hypothetical protein
MGIDDKQLDEMLKGWEYHPTLDADIRQKVRERIHNKYFTGAGSAPVENNFSNWLVTFFAQPLYASLLLLAIIASTFGIATLPNKNNRLTMDREIPLLYRQIIDPASSAKAQIEKYNNFQAISQHDIASRKTLEKALSWIERKVDLSDRQSLEFEHIHEQYFDEFESLYTNLLNLENEYRVFERQRVAGEEVNLLSVYENLNSQKEIYKTALQIQQKFIGQIFQVLDAEQKGKYGELFLTPTPEVKPSAFFSGTTSEWKI